MCCVVVSVRLSGGLKHTVQVQHNHRQTTPCPAPRLPAESSTHNGPNPKRVGLSSCMLPGSLASAVLTERGGAKQITRCVGRSVLAHADVLSAVLCHVVVLPALQMVKPRERNTRYVDAVMTIPKGTLFPMCGMNLAFDRLVCVCCVVSCWGLV